MARTVTVIPATIDPVLRKSGVTAQKRRVAAYARVSTDKDEQFTSYEAQIDYYTQYIAKRADWEFVKVYTDEGISGLGTKKRDGFNEMIADALAGKIDLIITKSVSRFARNTVDSLVTIRKLKEKNVEVFFEKENIYSLDGKGELLLTIMSSLAQEESRSISENVTWGHRKRFSDGKVNLPYKHFLGYDKAPKKDDPPIINREQAVIVEKIYSMFMEGSTEGAIARSLTRDGILSPAGKTEWRASTVASILRNEKYRGSALLQKEITVDFITHTRKKNEGEVPRYYIEKSHEAIIDPEEWDAVQEEILRRKEIGRSYSGKSIFSARIQCGDCGSWFISKVWHSNDKYKSRVWQCSCKYEKGRPHCGTPHLYEDDIKTRFVAAFNGIIANRAFYLDACETAKAVLADTAEADAELSGLTRELEVISELTRKCIQENSSAVLDQEEYNALYDSYVARYEKTKERFDELTAQKEEKLRKAKAIDRFASAVAARNGCLDEFDSKLWTAVVEKVTALNSGVLVFRFINGSEVSG